jgi:hypothetical protein
VVEGDAKGVTVMHSGSWVGQGSVLQGHDNWVGRQGTARIVGASRAFDQGQVQKGDGVGVRVALHAVVSPGFVSRRVTGYGTHSFDHHNADHRLYRAASLGSWGPEVDHLLHKGCLEPVVGEGVQGHQGWRVRAPAQG